MATAVFGGSFNPIHNGHIEMAKYALENLSISQLVLLPVYQAPHKNESNLLDFRHRVRLVKKAKASLSSELQSRVRISVLERSMPLPNYSYRTLKSLADLCNDATLHFILGYDMLAYLPKWKNVNEIVSTYPLIVFDRNGNSAQTEYKSLNHTMPFTEKPVIINNFNFKISSTEIRQKLTEYYISSEDIRKVIKKQLVQMIPKPVLECILEQGFYQINSLGAR